MSEGHPVRPVARGDEAAVARLRALCLSFTDAVEKRSHGEPTWFAGKAVEHAAVLLRGRLAADVVVGGFARSGARNAFAAVRVAQ